jgi:hypothetical protein
MPCTHWDGYLDIKTGATFEVNLGSFFNQFNLLTTFVIIGTHNFYKNAIIDGPGEFQVQGPGPVHFMGNGTKITFTHVFF